MSGRNAQKSASLRSGNADSRIYGNQRNRVAFMRTYQKQNKRRVLRRKTQSVFAAYSVARKPRRGKKLKIQTEWSDGVRTAVWTEIIRNKIYQQAEFLRDKGSDKADLLYGYVSELLPGDSTNREGHAAKVYFGELFGKTFTREDENAFNAALDYGYAILLSAFNRAICACGYNTLLGLSTKTSTTRTICPAISWSRSA